MQKSAVQRSTLAHAVDAVLREAGGGRVASVRESAEYGRPGFAVQFVRGDWLCTATIDVLSGEVTSIVPDGWGFTAAGSGAPADLARDLAVLELPNRAIWDLQPAVGEPGIAYVATDVGVTVVGVGATSLTLEAEHATGFGSTRQVASLPGGVVGITGDGRVFRLDRDGGHRWERRLPAAPYSIAVNDSGRRALIATNAGAVEIDTADGRPECLLGDAGRPVRAAAYLSSGDRVLATHTGHIAVLAADDTVRWGLHQGEYPERLWTRRDRIYVAGEGGLKEIAVGDGVVCRWSTPAGEAVESAIVEDSDVYTCSPGRHVAAHGYATSRYVGLIPGRPTPPEVITAVGGLLMTGYRDGSLSAQRMVG